MHLFVHDNDRTSLLLGHAFMGQLFYTAFNEHAYNEVNVYDSLLCMFVLIALKHRSIDKQHKNACDII